MTFPLFAQRIFAVLLGLACACASAQRTGAPAQQSAAPAPASTPALPDEPHLRQLIQRGHAADALTELDTLAARSPEPPYVERLRGLALYTRGDLAAAERAFAAALLRDPRDRESTEMRGITLFRIGRPADAIPLLTSLRTQPTSATLSPVDPAYVLALCYLDTRRYDEARGAFALQFGFPPDSAEAYLLAARMLLRREYVPVAQQFARRALELQPSLPLAHLLLGETELAGNHLDEAIHELEAERTLSPLEPAVYDRLGDAYTRRGDFDGARAALQEAILLEPNATGPFILLGKVLLKQGQAAAAQGFLEHARDMDPGNYMTHSLLGQAYRQTGRPEEARRETDLSQQLQSAANPSYTKPKTQNP